MPMDQHREGRSVLVNESHKQLRITKRLQVQTRPQTSPVRFYYTGTREMDKRGAWKKKERKERRGRALEALK